MALKIKLTGLTCRKSRSIQSGYKAGTSSEVGGASPSVVVGVWVDPKYWTGLARFPCRQCWWWWWCVCVCWLSYLWHCDACNDWWPGGGGGGAPRGLQFHSFKPFKPPCLTRTWPMTPKPMVQKVFMQHNVEIALLLFVGTTASPERSNIGCGCKFAAAGGDWRIIGFVPLVARHWDLQLRCRLDFMRIISISRTHNTP